MTSQQTVTTVLTPRNAQLFDEQLQQDIDQFPNKQITEQERCMICYDWFNMGEIIKELPCKHFYHPCCLLPWLRIHSECPLCRKKLKLRSYSHRLQTTVSDLSLASSVETIGNQMIADERAWLGRSNEREGHMIFQPFLPFRSPFSDEYDININIGPVNRTFDVVPMRNRTHRHYRHRSRPVRHSEQILEQNPVDSIMRSRPYTRQLARQLRGIALALRRRLLQRHLNDESYI